MLLVSEVEETEIFKICLEYWNHLAAELYRESPFSTSSTPLLSDGPPRRPLSLPVLSQVPPPLHTHTSDIHTQLMLTVSHLQGFFSAKQQRFLFGKCQKMFKDAFFLSNQQSKT